MHSLNKWRLTGASLIEHLLVSVNISQFYLADLHTY